MPESIRSDESSIAETIENNVRKRIVDENPTNPKYFEKMSILLDELIEQRRQESIDYKEYLEEIARLAEQVSNPVQSSYPKEIDTFGKQALFDNLSQDTGWVKRVHDTVQSRKQDGYLANKMKQKHLKTCLEPLAQEKGLDVEKMFELIIQQAEYRA
ncbi:hypothetical protein [Eikenella longinqua]|uniref:hypothetical protein n=1 Tax=Eikenella longinqua TaxID=1795827 RepID=UPI000AACFA1C|nr:hypothetical protein [Eikenella longinqua]